ncbi:hypothetical protein RIF29_19207 [Crotalaria pallida]|uniref:Glycosyltransferase n=1 Tax=Crotalaria pallida TaxID=3830 RepID=A0AAN9I6A7_CROPI
MSNPIPTVLILPCPATGHVNPMMTIALKLSEHECNIIFVNTDFNHKRVVKQETNNGLPIKLVSISDGLGAENDRSDAGELCESMLNTMPAMLEKLIEDIHLSGDHKITCIVADMAMGWAMEVAHKLRIRGALFWTASAAMFALTSNTPWLIDNGTIDSEGRPITTGKFQLLPNTSVVMDSSVIWWSKIGDSMLQKKVFNYFVQCIKCINLTEWWLCNTTYELELRVLSSLPKLLPIGPLLRSCDNASTSTTSLGQFWDEDHSCMSWLDQQPRHSVLYVAFGSTTLFDQNQFTELALGLELTNQPFLWVVRQDCNSSNEIAYPSEFQGQRGNIVGWAPQEKVLNHPSIACFVSHCGWNSTMEGLSNGVPFLCWPYYTDQFHNKTYICEELKVGLGFDFDEKGLVSRDEIKMKIDLLLRNDNIRSRSLELKEKLICNIAKRGQSSENLRRFVEWLKE